MASFKHMANGKVKITITHGKTFDGKAKKYYKTVEYTSDRQLDQEAALFLADVINGEVNRASSTTVAALYKDFIDVHKELKASTLSRYESLFNNQIKPYFGFRKLNTITRPDIRKWVNVLLERGHKATMGPLAPKTVKSALSLLSDLFNHAVYELEIVEKNPCERIKVPKLEKSSVVKEFYTDEDLGKLLVILDEKLDNPRTVTHATLIFLILFTGLRTAEVMGLRWEDVDMRANTINIDENRIYTSNIGIITDTTKTRASMREISIPVFITDMLKRLKLIQEDWKIKMGADWTDSGYVAITDKGTPQHPRNTYKWFKRLLKKNGLKDATVHDLRHTHAAILSSMGVKIIDISKRLGHSNTRVTQEVYEYLFKDMDNVISLELDNYYRNVAKM